MARKKKVTTRTDRPPSETVTKAMEAKPAPVAPAAVKEPTPVRVQVPKQAPRPTLRDHAAGCLAFLPLAGASSLLVAVALSLPTDKRMRALNDIAHNIATVAGALPLPQSMQIATADDWKQVSTAVYHAQKYATGALMADLCLFMDYAVQGMEPSRILGLLTK